MKTHIICVAVLSFFSSLQFVFAQGTAFTYQGQLISGGAPANGSYDVAFTLFDAETNGAAIAGPVTNSATAVTNGLFTATIDFGSVFHGSNYWLELAVQTNGGSGFTTLAPRQPITPTPYAIFANTASNVSGTVSASQLSGSIPANQLSGTIPLAQLPGGVITNTANLTLSNLTAVGTFNVPITVFSSNNPILHYDGNNNFFTAPGAGNLTTSGSGNTANGYQALNLNAGGSANVAIGFQALHDNTNGANNTAIGYQTLQANKSGANNTAVGLDALLNNTTGNFNIGVGDHAGFNITTGSNNIEIGNQGFSTDTNIIRIGTSQAQTFIAGVINGNGGGLTNLNASQISSGTVNTSQIPNLDASKITTGTIALAQLSGITSNQLSATTWQLATNLNGGNAALASNVVSGISITNAFITNSIFAGNGGGLTNLNASQISSGTLSLAQLPGTVLTNGSTGVNISGTFSGNGSGVTNVSLYSLNSFGAISSTGTNWGNLGTITSLSTGIHTKTLTVADINGDGKPDFIVGSDFNNTLRAFTNNGSGGFATACTFNSMSGPTCLPTADVNNDGRMDVVVVNYDYSLLTVFTNNGSGVFSSNSVVGAGASPRSVAAADVNSDGKTDLAAVNYYDGTMTVVTNNGSGGFAYSFSTAVGINPVAIVTADVNSDGKPDMITGSQGGPLTVMTNNGSGGFVQAVSLPGFGPINPQITAAADINGDGKVDLLTFCPNFGAIVVYTNGGSGGFKSASTNTVGDYPEAITTADINGDGKLDVFCAIDGGSNNGYVMALTNNGAAGFTNMFRTSNFDEPIFVAAADINGDGGTDLIYGDPTFNQIKILMNGIITINAAFTGSGSALTSLNASAITSGTFNGNGSGLTNMNASQISTGTVSLALLPPAVVTNTETGVTLGGTFSGNGSGLTNVNALSLGGNAITTNGNSVVLGTTLNAAFHPIYLKGAGDVNHGLASMGSFTNFTALTPPDGPVLWGFGGGSLGTMNGGPKLGLVWTTSGVGIGTTNPASALHVVSASGDAEISVQSGDPGSHRWTLQSSATNGGVNLSSSFQIVDRTAGTSRLLIQTNGNVGIGTTSPQSTLQVNGTITATSFNGPGGSIATNYLFAYDTNSQAASTGGPQQITFNNASAQNDGWTYSAGSFTCPRSGLYLIQYSAHISSTATATNATLWVRDFGPFTEIPGSEATVDVTAANKTFTVSKSFIANLSSLSPISLILAGTTVGNPYSLTSAGNSSTKTSVTLTIVRIK